MSTTTPAPRVFVVDDSEVIRDLISVNLELEGFEVITGVDGQDCLDRIDDVDPDLVTLDVVMPRLGGFETARRLRMRPRTARLPLVLVTAAAQAADRACGEEIGVDAYITKPFEPAVLVSVIRRLTAAGERTP